LHASGVVSIAAHPEAMVPLVIGVTSHRNIPAREIEPIRERVREFFIRLKHDFPALPLVVLSALAEGGDQLVAEEALAIGARLIAPLPLPRELYVEDFTDAATRAGFEALYGRAEVMQLPRRRGLTRCAIAGHGLERDRQYAQAGVYVASHCHILLAIWDGKASDRLGGTAQIVRYHLSGALPGVMDRRRGARHVFGGGDERLTYHIVCSRDEVDGAPAAGLQPLQSWWRTANHTAAAAEGLPAEFALMFARMTEFNTECSRYAGAIDQTTQANHYAPPPPTATIDRMFSAADWLAVHFCQRVLLAMRSTYTLAGLMGIAFMCYSDLPAQDYMIFVFLLLFALGGLIAMLAQRRGWHRKYLDYRALAEGLRVQVYWRRAGISVTGDPEFAHDNFLQKQDVELGWIRNVMRAAGLPAPGQPAAPAVTASDDVLERVIAEWIGEPGQSGQLGYYERKAVERTRLNHRTEQIGLISLRAGIAISVFLAVFVFKLSQDAKTMLVAIMAVLSITAAVREAYAYRKADKELIKQYRFMQRIFASAYAALHATRDPLERRDILRALGEAALAEHAEWTLMHRERPVEPGKL
jgi:hypothetical protein